MKSPLVVVAATSAGLAATVVPPEYPWWVRMALVAGGPLGAWAISALGHWRAAILRAEAAALRKRANATDELEAAKREASADAIETAVSSGPWNRAPRE